jgi:hypothetical protein
MGLWWVDMEALDSLVGERGIAPRSGYDRRRRSTSLCSEVSGVTLDGYQKHAIPFEGVKEFPAFLAGPETFHFFFGAGERCRVVLF